VGFAPQFGLPAGLRNTSANTHASRTVTVQAVRLRGKQGAPEQQEPARVKPGPTQVKGSDAPHQLSRLWREHLEAGCPTELIGVEIAGTDARALDAEITACVSALLTHTITVDGRIERRLTEISTALIS
jgi:hypothetical protein